MRTGTITNFSGGVGTIAIDGGGTIALHVSAWRGFSGSADFDAELPKAGDRVKFEGGDVVARCWPEAFDPTLRPATLGDPVHNPPYPTPDE